MTAGVLPTLAVPLRAPARHGAGPGTVVPTLRVERRLWREGHGVVAGLDEVGRGAWAGPVSVGVVVLRPGLRTRSVPGWLRDSKQLAEQRREEGFEELAAWCPAWAVGHAEAAECDRFGMTAALRLASYRALARLGVRVDALVVDGPRDLLARPRTGAPGTTSEPRPLPLLPPAPEPSTAPLERPLPLPDLALPDVALPATVVPVIRGDARCVSVAAASVLAKVVRDRRMRAEAEHFPPYAFERNKGYPSATHQCALRGYGLSAIHRRSWAFVDDLPWR